MDLVYNKKTEQILEILSKIKELSLAYKEIIDPVANVPSIVDGSKSYTGIEEMKQYLELLDSEKGKWYYCDC